MDTQVLIVGAGPVGLTLALELARMRVQCRVVDRAAGPSDHSRALIVHCRTQELLDRDGLRDRFVDHAIEVRGVRLSRGRRDLATIPFDLGRFPALSIPQRQTEQILRAVLAERGVEVEWGSELTEIERLPGAVEALIGGESCTAAFVVGCDGAHSTIRHLLNVPFEGDSIPEVIWMADATLDWDVRPDYVRQFLHRDGALSAIPMPGGVWRLATLSSDHGGEPTVEYFKSAVERSGSPQPAQMEIHWASAFRVNCRLAARYGRDHVFLAGDAAHIYSPIGGQGMNVGMQDAFNLAPKLAAALVDADDSILAGYEAERRPVAAAVIRTNARIARLAAKKGPVAGLVRNHLVPRVLSVPRISRRAGLAASGLTLPEPQPASGREKQLEQ